MHKLSEYADCSFITEVQLKELLALVEELKEFKNLVLNLPKLGEGAHSLTVLHTTSDHHWIVTHRQDNRRIALSEPCNTPDEAIKQAFSRCCRCWIRPHEDWPTGETGRNLCQGCWEKQCSKLWWTAVQANDGGVPL